jgi:hypothetical protein
VSARPLPLQALSWRHGRKSTQSSQLQWPNVDPHQPHLEQQGEELYGLHVAGVTPSEAKIGVVRPLPSQALSSRQVTFAETADSTKRRCNRAAYPCIPRSVDACQQQWPPPPPLPTDAAASSLRARQRK